MKSLLIGFGLFCILYTTWVVSQVIIFQAIIVEKEKLYMEGYFYAEKIAMRKNRDYIVSHRKEILAILNGVEDIGGKRE